MHLHSSVGRSMPGRKPGHGQQARPQALDHSRLPGGVLHQSHTLHLPTGSDHHVEHHSTGQSPLRCDELETALLEMGLSRNEKGADIIWTERPTNRHGRSQTNSSGLSRRRVPVLLGQAGRFRALHDGGATGKSCQDQRKKCCCQTPHAAPLEQTSLSSHRRIFMSVLARLDSVV